MEFEQRKPDEELIISGKPISFSEILRMGGREDITTEGNKDRKINIEVSPQSIIIQPEDEKNFFLRAEISPIAGDLILNLQLKDKLGNRYAGLPYAQPFVNKAIPFLESHQKIEKFTATWKDGSDNFNEYLKNRNKYKSDNEAVFNTWTGRNVAIPFGFTSIDNISKDMHSDDRFVIVKFSRPTVEASVS